MDEEHPIAERAPAAGAPTARIAWRHVALGTVSFALCFAAWGLIGALAPRFRDQLGLSGIQNGLLVATPVLLGSLARIPLGILADRFGARLTFAALMAVTAVPALLIPAVHTYGTLLAVAFCLLIGFLLSTIVPVIVKW